VEEDVPAEGTMIDNRRPAASADRVALVVSAPGELRAGLPVTRAETVKWMDLAGTVLVEFDEAGLDQVDHVFGPRSISTIRHLPARLGGGLISGVRQSPAAPR
jgi:hypothetical protein